MTRVPSEIERRVGKLLFWLWVPAALLVGASLLAAHWITLPTPARDDERLLAALAELRVPGERDDWMVVHVLYAACKCSGRVVDHLVEEPRPTGIADKVLLVGSVPEIDQRLAASPLTVVHTTAAELAERYDIEGAPLLLVVDPTGALRYRGGYTERKQSLAIQDIAILERLRTEGDVAALPLFGCAVSKRLRELLDPLGLRASPPADTPE